MGALDGRVAIITGAGRGLGREHALLFAAEGAKVVVNDRGGANDGAGADASPAEQVAQEIRDLGGEAVSNGDDIADWDGAQALVNTAVDAFGDLDILVNNAGILRDRVLDQHVRAGVGRRRARPHEGPLRAEPLGRRLLARADQGRRRQAAQHRPHVVDVGPPVEPRAEQLRRRQVGHRHVQPDPRQGARALRREEQLHRPGRPHPADAGDARPRRDHGAEGRLVRRVGPEERVAARVLPGVGRLRLHGRDVLRPGRHRQARPVAGRWPRRSSRRRPGRSPRSARRSPPTSRTDEPCWLWALATRPGRRLAPVAESS